MYQFRYCDTSIGVIDIQMLQFVLTLHTLWQISLAICEKGIDQYVKKAEFKFFVSQFYLKSHIFQQVLLQKVIFSGEIQIHSGQFLFETVTLANFWIISLQNEVMTLFWDHLFETVILANFCFQPVLTYTHQ